MEASLDNVDVDVITNDDEDVILNVESAELRMYKLIVANQGLEFNRVKLV